MARSDAREKHEETMRRLQNLRDDVRGVISDAINKFYDYPPETLDAEQAERERIKEYLHDAKYKIDSVINDL